MSKSIEQLENDINSSRYFSLMGEGMEAARKTAKGKLINDLWDYCKSRKLEISNDFVLYSDYGEEVWKAMEASIKAFVPGKAGTLLQFFNGYCKSFLNKKIIHTELKMNPKERKPGKKERKMDPKKAIKGSPKKVRQFNKIIDENGNAINEEDTFSTTNFSPRLETPEEHLTKAEDTKLALQVLDIIDNDYKNQQKRCQTKYQQRLYTEKYRDIIDAAENLSPNYAFIDYEWLKRYPSKQEAPSNTEIAARYGKDTADASRTIRVFNKKISNEINMLLHRYGIPVPNITQSSQIEQIL